MNKKITILLGLFCVLVAFNILAPNNNSTDISNKKTDLYEPVILEPTIEPKIAKSWSNFTSIHIKNNWSIAATKEWCSGDGSAGNPYVIENMTIDAKGGDFGIKIEDSINDYFVLRNITIYNQSGDINAGGIVLFYSNNGTIVNCNISDCEYGIHTKYGDNNTIEHNILENCESGLYLNHGMNVSLNDNNFTNCGLIVSGSLEEAVAYNITTSNTINNKPIYFYANKSNLAPENFTDAGAVLCYYCNHSRISDLNVPYGRIALYTCLNITVKNVSASFAPYAGIDIIWSQNITVRDSKTNDNILYGIRLFYSEECNISDNRMQNELNGIFLVRSYNNTISNNTMTNCGITIDDEDGLISSDNDIDTLNTVNEKIVYYYEDNDTLGLDDFTNAGQIILINCSVSELSHFKLSNLSQGMYIYHTDCPLIYNNSLEHINGYGIFMLECNETKIYQNNVTDCGTGLKLNYCLDFNITQNNVSGCVSHGVDMLSVEATITFNNFSYNGENGIILSDSNNFTYNTISFNKKNGIYVIGSIIRIYRNHIYQNEEAGIYIDDMDAMVRFNKIYNNSDGVIINYDMNGISKNLIANNSRYGVAIFGSSTINNNVYDNTFSKNLVSNGYDEGSPNMWDGNRWDDYSGKDTDDNGMGDTAYPISGGTSQDNWPIYWDPPVINVTSPLNNTLYGKEAPSFSGFIWEGVADTQWYTLGNNPKKYNFTGIIFFGTINQTGWDAFGNGTVLIHFFVNDSRGYIDQEDIIVRKDIIPPNITIVNPIENKVFNATAPDFEITITGLNLNESWYRIGNGTEWSINYTIGGSGSQRSGQIEQDAWNDRPNGSVIIEFYANDTLDNIGMNSTIIRKDVLGPIITISNPTPNGLFFSTAPELGDCNVDFSDVSGIDDKWHMLINATDSNHHTDNYTWNGQVNQTAWNQMGNGTVIIRIFANDSSDYIGRAEVIVRKDIELPDITITDPSLNDIFGNATMNFTISVSGRNLESICYMLINGTNNLDYTNNFTYSETVSSGIIEDTIDYNLWNQFENGTVIIRFFLNRTTGPRAFDEVIVRKDIIAPEITIIEPIVNQSVYSSPPEFIIIVVETNNDTMWYQLFNGTIYTDNYTFSSNDTINEEDWDDMWKFINYGEMIWIIFYCNDTAGNMGVANVTVIKTQGAPDGVLPPSDGDDDDDGKKAEEGVDIALLVLIIIGVFGGIATVAIIVIKKRIAGKKRIKEIRRIEEISRE